ncbi:MAG: hypothetical protein AAB895_02875, partial [Patescibacteria group bacterium]
SGIRLGTPAITTRGLKEKDMVKVAKWMNAAIEEVRSEVLPTDKEERSKFIKDFRVRVAKNKKLLAIAIEVKTFTKKYPLP